LQPKLVVRWSAFIALVGCTLALAVGAFTPAAQSTSAGSTTQPTARAAVVVFLRHAEKDASDHGADPGLSDAGHKRARALAQLLGHAAVGRLCSSEYRRAKETLDPLRERTGRDVEVVPAADVARWVQLLESTAAGSVTVVVGHSNTIPALVERLGGRVTDLESTPQGAMIRDSEYDRMLVATLDGSDPAHKRIASLLELRYGD
jgi:phosphohistidine phosphatase SixA